ncbi:MAG: M15 family metallopeptidase [Bacteroidia bacterium]|nr:M15 family metallopeptidase [Bacteroidia bacterium]
MKRIKLKRIKLIGTVLVVTFCIWVLVGIGIWINVKITNWRRLNEIEGVSEASYQTFNKFIDDIESQTDWNVEIISGLRSRERQKELLRENSKNASIDKSRHVLGRAIDINLYRKNWLWRVWLKKFNSKRDWKNTGVVRISEKYGLLWGGSYHTYHDPVHFEIR